MTERTYIRRGSGESIATSSYPNITSSPFIELLNPKLDIEIAGYEQGVMALYAFYNSDKEYITASTGVGGGFKKHIIPASDIPANAKYIRYTGDSSNNSYIVGGVKLKSFDTYFQDIIESSAGGENPINPIGAITITGASLTYDGNTWFGLANKKLGTTAINKARNGIGNPSTDALSIWKKEFWTESEFEDIGVFAFQYANVADLDEVSNLLGSYLEYTPDYIEGAANPFSSYSEAQCLDYILKFLQAECYAQKDNPSSKWFGTQHGKPFRVMFVTHWHDGRPYYNLPIRTVAKRWGSAVCEFDKKIGFSKETPLSDGKQVSVLYAQDTQVADGITLGWHPKRGTDSAYIQGRMAEIFSASIREWFM